MQSSICDNCVSVFPAGILQPPYFTADLPWLV